MFPDFLLKIGDKEFITLYGISIAIGVVLCIIVLRKYGKIIGVDQKFIDFSETLGYITILFGFFGAALFQAIYNYIENPTNGFHISIYNITFLGGLISGVLFFFVAYFIFRNKLTGRIIDILPIAPCCITIAHAFGRIGCNFAGCCYGKVVPEGKWYSWIAVDMVYHEHVFPTQLMEAFFLLILFFVMSYLVLKKKFNNTFPIYFAGYGIWRFFIEYLRADDRGVLIPGISPSQFISLIMIVLAVPLFFILRKLFKAREEEKKLMAVMDTNANEPTKLEK